MKFGPDQRVSQRSQTPTAAGVATLALAAALPALGADIPSPAVDKALTNLPRKDVPTPVFDFTFGSQQNAPVFKFSGPFPSTTSAAVAAPASSVSSTNAPVPALREAALNPAPEQIGQFRSSLRWIDQTLSGPTSWFSNLAGITTFVAGLAAGFAVIRNYRKNPRSLHKESILLREGKSPVFVHDDKQKISALCGDFVERAAVFSAARKVTEKFPILFIDPKRNPEVISDIRDAVATRNIKREIEENSSPGDLKTNEGRWHLVIVPRKSFLGLSPIICADFFTFTKMVAMLEDPVKLYHDLKGMDRRHFIYHLEDASLVAYLHPIVLTRAIKEAHIDALAGMPDDAARTKFTKEAFERLTHNSKVLLRLLCFSTADSLKIFDEAAPGESLDHLMEAVPFETIERMIAERRKQKTWYERLVEPVIHRIWHQRDVSKVWLAARTPPEDLGLFDCCSVAEM